MGGRGTWVAAVLAGVVLAGCDPSAPPAPRAEATPSPSPFLYGCHVSVFDPAVVKRGGLERDDPELRDLVESLERSHPDTIGGWRVVSDEGGRVDAIARIPTEYVSPSYSRSFASASFSRTGDGFAPDGFEKCQAEAVIGRRSPARWELAEEPAPSDTELVVIAEEMACSSGRELTQRNTRSHVEYTGEAITIVVTGDPILGGNCVDNQGSRLTVDLDEPVGDRELVDAAVYPPKRRHP